jgi:beta-lactamase class D
MRVLTLSAALVWLALTSLSIAADGPNWQNRADWSRVFADAGVKGTALIYDEAGQRWLVHDRERAEHGYSPASTFKIFNAMADLDAGAVKDEYEVIRWDGKKRMVDGWNRDHSLASGMKFSVVWFYQEMARRVGAERMQGWLDQVGYGNRRIGGAIDMFWLDNSLRISAVQQIEFLRRLADGTLPFSERAQETVRRITIIEDAPHWILHAKTGWSTTGAVDEMADLGWIVGWLERDGRRWFFAINIDMPTADDAQKRLPIARKLLEDVGAFGGNRE